MNFNEKQFAILDELRLQKTEFNTRIIVIQREIENLKKDWNEKLTSIYPKDTETLYLMTGYDVNYTHYHLAFHALSKTSERRIDLYFKKHLKPFSTEVDKASEIIEDILKLDKNPLKRVEYRDDPEAFGYFDDIEKNYLREDWIFENIVNDTIPLIITKKIYLSACNKLFDHISIN